MNEELARIEETNCPKCGVTLDAIVVVTGADGWLSGLCPACSGGIRVHAAKKPDETSPK